MKPYMEKIVVGTAQFGMDYGINNPGGKVKQNEVSQIFECMQSYNLNQLDTAKEYGDSEIIIGQQIKKINQKWVISTKVSDLDTQLKKQLDDSGRKLNIYPKIILAHSSNIYLKKKFQSQIKDLFDHDSSIRVGVSLYTEDEIISVLKSGFKPNIIQVPLNILDSSLYSTGLLSYCKSLDIEIHARSIFLQGLFYWDIKNIKNSYFKDAYQPIAKLITISEKANISLPELSLLWVINLKEVQKVIIGVDNKHQLLVHLNTLRKQIKPEIFEEALSLKYANKNILNPSLWK